jgi:hypothetical protein
VNAPPRQIEDWIIHGLPIFSLLGFQILTDAAQLNEAQCGPRAKHGSKHHGHNSIHPARAVACKNEILRRREPLVGRSARPKNLVTVSEPSKENEFSGLTER